MFTSLVYAQETAEAAQSAQQQNAFVSFIPFVLIFLVFYFLIIKPQKKRMQEEQAFNSALKKGDEVYTKSGILGTIAGMTDKIVTLELEGGVKIKFLRSQVAGSSKNIFSSEKK